MGYQNGAMFIQMVVSGLHLVLCYILSHYFQMGVDGPALAMTISYVNTMVITYVYTGTIKDEKVR